MSGLDTPSADETVRNAPIWPKPPAVTLLFIAAGFALERLVPLAPVKSPAIESVVAGAAIAACALGIAFLAVRQMSRLGTTVFPGERANALVTNGVFGRSRNPIYLAFVLFTIGLGVAFSNAWLLLAGPLLALYLSQRVIKREEAYLGARFGEAYALYKLKTRRWF